MNQPLSDESHGKMVQQFTTEIGRLLNRISEEHLKRGYAERQILRGASDALLVSVVHIYSNLVLSKEEILTKLLENTEFIFKEFFRLLNQKKPDNRH